MYIDPFLAGVLATILVLSVGLVLLGLFSRNKTDKGDKN